MPGLPRGCEEDGSETGGSSSGSLARRGTSSGNSPVSHLALPAGGAAQQPEAPADGGVGRRCVHCGSTKTPQWRLGPAGPKTLCNACGVRYKNGRLQPVVAFPPLGALSLQPEPRYAAPAQRMPALSPAKRTADVEPGGQPYLERAFSPGPSVPKKPRGSTPTPLAPQSASLAVLT